MCKFAAFDEFEFCFLQVFGVGNPPRRKKKISAYYF